jgi:predicted regulator of Ras-like GTPase activity (Roadblock/LC7/MglB family)
MFREALQGVVEGTEGGLAGILMDSQGIPLEIYQKGEASFDIEAVGVEASPVLKAIQRATEMLEAGSAREIYFSSDKLVTIIRVLSQEYFMALTMNPNGNFGKARYLMRCVAPRLAAELS